MSLAHEVIKGELILFIGADVLLAALLHWLSPALETSRLQTRAAKPGQQRLKRLPASVVRARVMKRRVTSWGCHAQFSTVPCFVVV